MRYILIAQKKWPTIFSWAMAICAKRRLPSDGNDALAHDARRIRFGNLSEATTMRGLAGNQRLNAHVLFLFMNFLNECVSIRTNILVQSKEFIFFKIRIPSQGSIANSSATQSYAHDADRAQGQRWIG